jgi:hypothetical protein
MPAETIDIAKLLAPAAKVDSGMDFSKLSDLLGSIVELKKVGLEEAKLKMANDRLASSQAPAPIPPSIVVDEEKAEVLFRTLLESLASNENTRNLKVSELPGFMAQFWALGAKTAVMPAIIQGIRQTVRMA